MADIRFQAGSGRRLQAARGGEAGCEHDGDLNCESWNKDFTPGDYASVSTLPEVSRKQVDSCDWRVIKLDAWSFEEDILRSETRALL